MLDLVNSVMETYRKEGRTYPAVCCSFDSTKSLEDLNELCLSLLQASDFVWEFFLKNPSDDEMFIPDLGKGYLQDILEMEPTKLLLIQNIVELWGKKTGDSMYELCELISGMSDEVG